MNWMKDRNLNKSADELFLTLIRIAQEDREVASQLQAMLNQSPDIRKHLVKAYAADLQKKSAPDELVAAVACLCDDAIAEKALNLISNHSAD
jgi:hypothetical protein